VWDVHEKRFVDINRNNVSRWISSAERVTGLAVRLCYGVTGLGVLVLMVLGMRDMVGDGRTDGQRARDQYTQNPGFDREESRRNRERAEKATRGKYP
jgi:hypothetical protein